MSGSGSMDAADRWQALRGGLRPDCPPVSFWRHFYDQENELEQFVEATIGFQKRFGWDLVKINPRASYHVEPWGVTVRPSAVRDQKPVKTSWPVHNADELKKIRPLPSTSSEFDFQLRAVAEIRKALTHSLPMVMTMFTPLSVLGDLVPSGELLKVLLQESPDAVTMALENLATTFSALAVEFLNAGADGLFFATTEWASRDRLTAEEYRRFGRPYDLRILEAISASATFTVLHICGPNVILEEFADYPCHIVNWDATHPANLSLRQGWEVMKKPVLGGIDGSSDLLGLSLPALADKVRRMIAEHADLPYAVGPGCAVPVQVPLERLQVIKEVVQQAGEHR